MTTEGLDTMKLKSKYFIVINFKEGDSTQVSRMRLAAQKALDGDYYKYSIYTVFFYKESSSLSRNFKETDADLLAWHGDEIVLSFEWKYGRYAFSIKYKDGMIVE